MSPIPERPPVSDGWIRRQAPSGSPRTHMCLPPVEPRRYYVRPTSPWPRHLGPPPDLPEQDAPAGEAGDLWRCVCGGLWQVSTDERFVPGGTAETLRWRRAPWWTRLRYSGTPAAAPAPVKPSRPPAGPSGVSPSPDGRR